MSKIRTYALTLEATKKILENAKINVIEGHIYSVYACGHIFDAVDDPQKTLYLAPNNSHNRVCPECYNEDSKLLVKYKKCGCSAEQLGYNVQQSKCCKYCPPERVRKYKKVATSKKSTIYNDKFADPKKWNCEYRDECLTKFSKHHRAIPCKDCTDYIIGKKWIR